MNPASEVSMRNSLIFATGLKRGQFAGDGTGLLVVPGFAVEQNQNLAVYCRPAEKSAGLRPAHQRWSRVQLVVGCRCSARASC